MLFCEENRVLVAPVRYAPARWEACVKAFAKLDALNESVKSCRKGQVHRAGKLVSVDDARSQSGAMGRLIEAIGGGQYRGGLNSAVFALMLMHGVCRAVVLNSQIRKLVRHV